MTPTRRFPTYDARLLLFTADPDRCTDSLCLHIRSCVSVQNPDAKREFHHMAKRAPQSADVEIARRLRGSGVTHGETHAAKDSRQRVSQKEACRAVNCNARVFGG